jgi:hypothetical protein
MTYSFENPETNLIPTVTVETKNNKIFFKYTPTNTVAICTELPWYNDSSKKTLYIERIESKIRKNGGMKNVLQGIFKYFLENNYDYLNIDAVATDDVSTYLLKEWAKKLGFRFSGYEGGMSPEEVIKNFKNEVALILQ